MANQTQADGGTTADLMQEATAEAARLYRCAAECEDAGFPVMHVDPQADTGVLLEAYDEEDRLTAFGGALIQITGDCVRVTTPEQQTKTDSVRAACEVVLEDI